MSSDTAPPSAPAAEPVGEGQRSAGSEPSKRPPATDKVVFGVAALVSGAIVAWGVLGTDSLSTVATGVLNWLVENLGWFFVIAATGFVGFAIYMAASRYGRIPLGQDGEKPEFRTVSWVAMMFSAGMGIGLMFFGVNEPLTHFVETPPGSRPGIGTAMATTLFHWTVHPWAIYAVVGLALAYGTYRRGRPQLISAAFTPLIGERRANGPAGKAIDVLAIFATLFGSAASLGLGALQIGAGFSENGWLSNPGTGLLVIVIAILTIAFIASAVSGVAKGIQYLSNINMVLALVLAVFVFVLGPTVLILNLVPAAIGDYFRDLAAMSARTAVSGGDATATWLSGWTIFYWAWWISWTPFVGMFIARISRGRTIRQFIAGVIAVPSVVSLVWFAIFGGAAISLQRSGTNLFGQGGEEAQLFGLLATFPLAGVTSVLVMVLVAIFFVSGADAASVVLGTMSQRGTQEPQTWVVIFWGVLTGAVAVVMLLVGGEVALDGLQTLTIIAAAPFAVLMVALCVALARDLRTDPMVIAERQVARQLREQAAARTRRSRSARPTATVGD
ncbi:MAG: BCCT family transporter [Pseudonocardiaceae bacterium]